MGSCASTPEFEYDYKWCKLSEAKIRPFDMIAFRGTGTISNTIAIAENKVLGNGDWTHVGVVVSKRYLTIKHGASDFKDDDLFLWESGISSNIYPAGSLAAIPDVETKHTIVGVQIRPLHELLSFSDKDHEIAVCILRNNPIDPLSEDSKEQYTKRMDDLKFNMDRLHHEYYQRSYQDNPCFLSAFCPSDSCTKIESSVFSNDKVICSQFATIIYQSIGVLPSEYDAHNILPIELIDPAVRSKIIITDKNRMIFRSPVIIYPDDKAPTSW